MALTEEQLEGAWIADPVRETRLTSFRSHYEKHGAEVEAADEEQYLRKAIEFSRIRRGRGERVPGMTPGARRWRKLGRYVDMTPDGEIVSFGAVYDE